jgi:hypothetical protein
VSSPGDACGLDVEFFASELRLRGDAPIVQPHQQDGDVFCWNGEAFEGLNVSPTWVLQLLAQCGQGLIRIRRFGTG